MSLLKRTACFDEHVKLGGRMIDFGGWELPVQYSGVIDEHLACRNAAGLFDVSHMGEIIVQGKDAEAFLAYLITNDLAKIKNGQAQYTVMCLDSAGVVDDLIVYKKSSSDFFVVVNASNTDKDFAHFQSMLERFKKETSRVDVKLENQSAKYSQLAIQGPKAVEILQMLTDLDLSTLSFFHFAEGKLLGSIPTLFARTGYTGEDGFEIYVAWDQAPAIWRALIEKGSPRGLKPVGLGARDTLRLEAKLHLYGHELTDQTNPLEAGLGWVVKLDKTSFVGKDALTKIKTQGVSRKLVGIGLQDRRIPRQGYAVWDGDKTRKIGEITSGTQSPCLQKPIALAYVEAKYADVGTRVCIEIRNELLSAEIVPTPFYKKKNQR